MTQLTAETEESQPLNPATPSTSPTISVPPEVIETARQSLGAFFEPLSGADPEANIRDFLDFSKAVKRARIIDRYTTLRSKKLLEIGSGFGTNLAMWIKHFDVDGYGVEPGGEGFNHGYLASQKVFLANDIDPKRIHNVGGEALPFEDASFDIVYSANVLEHTQDPEQVLSEAIRVLRPGGVLHVELPNYLSYYEGHYMVFQPPILFKSMLPFWVRFAFRRDPEFARTLQTQINPIWCRRVIKRLQQSYRLELVSDGSEIFLEALARPFQFETQTNASRLGGVLSAVQKLNWGNWIGRTIVAAQGHYPIYLTVRKLAGA